MMTLIHGEDSIGSYRNLSELIDSGRSANFDIHIFDSTSIDATALRQICGTGLFGGNKLIIIKSLLSNQKSKNRDLIISEIASMEDVDIVLYEPKNISLTLLKKFPKAKVVSHKINSVIFKYMDMFKSGNGKNLYSGWQRLLELGYEPEYIFSMIVRQVRLLIQAKSGPSYLKLSAYPKKLVLVQAGYFSLYHLLELHSKLYEIDKKIKTGVSSLSLEDHVVSFLIHV